MPNRLQFIMDVRVHDADAFYAKALDIAQEGGLPEAEAVEMLKPGGEIDLGACLVMIFDPGISPDGSTIEQSTHEYLEIEEDESDD